MDNTQQSKNKKLSLMIIGVAVLVIGLVGATYAFFNYTRTGTANTIRTGRIAFTTSQGTPINLTNMFPIIPTQENLADSTKVGTVTIDVSGDTTYNQGVEYLVTATNVVNTVGSGANQKTLPISIQVSYEAKTNKDIGTASNTYFADRGSTTSYYKVLSSDTINNGDRLLVGYIAPDNNETGIDGTITIKAYLDASEIAISDTYNGEETDNMGTTTNWVNNRVVLTTQEWNSLQQNGVSFQVRIEANEGIWVKDQIKYNANGGSVSPAYKEIENNATTYGTLATPTAPAGYQFAGWYTAATGGTLVESSTSYTAGTSATTLYAHYSVAAPATIASCLGCKFMYTTNTYYYGGVDNANATAVSQLTTDNVIVSTNYNDVITNDRKVFLGFTEVDDGNGNMVIDRAFACGIKGTDSDGNVNQGTPFCIEGSTDGSLFNDNASLLTGSTLWDDAEFTAGRCNYDSYYGEVYCYGSVESTVDETGNAATLSSGYECGVNYDGFLNC